MAEEERQATMRIATFNLENLGATRPGDQSVAARLALLRPQLLRLDADVLCIQEVNAPRDGTDGARTLSALDRLLEETPYAGYARCATHHPEGSAPMDRHNLVIASRLPLQSCRQVFPDLVPPPRHGLLRDDDDAGAVLAWERPLLHATLGLAGGRVLHVLNLHLRAPLAVSLPGHKSGPFSWDSTAAWAEGFMIATLKRSGQALEARLVVDALLDEDPQALIVVAGDFNAEAAESPTRILMACPDDTGNTALSGRALVALEHGLPAERRYTVIHGGRHVMLDHLLASAALAASCRGLEIHNEALSDELTAFAKNSQSPESYHAPVVATFELD
jgi:endonuclease/exonuclease/phosphatase family metal-dependent hydrolase